ncbi:MAG: hypothetical protein KDC46_00875 [Thermoleophilia bacterium]|nr:hypothetical protein [Thermoleophilia bacterium]
MQVRRHHRATALVVARSTGTQRVSASQLTTARVAVSKLPAADRALLARHGLRVELVPATALEDGMLGATSIVRDADGRWAPTTIRVASRIHGRGVESLAEVVQHEVGHAISVLRSQDRSEDAAGAYARTH